MPVTANRIVKNTGYLYARMGVTMFISLWTTRLVLNALGVSDFGIYSVVGGAIAMLGFLNSSMAAATQRFMNYVEGQGGLERKKEIFNTSILIHAVIGIAVLFVLTLCAFVFFNGIFNISPNRTHAAYVVYGCMVISTVLTVINTPYDAVLNSHENMRCYAGLGIFESVLKLLVAYACVYTTQDKLIVYGILMACIPAVTLTIMKVYSHRKYEECIIAPFKYYKKRTFKEMIWFAGWSFWGTSSGLMGNYGQLLVVNHFYGVAINAAIGIASQLDGQLHSFSNGMLKALNPVITKTEGSGEREKMLRYATTGCKFSFAILAVIAIPAIMEMQFIQKIWLKNVPEWAVLFTQLQLVRTLIDQVTVSYSTAIYAEGHIASYQIVKSIINIVPILILIVLFCKGGSPLYLYVINILVFGIVQSMITIYYAHKLCGLRYVFFFREHLCPISLSFFIALFITSIPSYAINEGWVRFTITLLFGIISYIVLFWFIGMGYYERKVAIDGFQKLQMRIKK